LQGGCSIPVLPESVGSDAYADTVTIQWRSDSGLFNDSCDLCRVPRLEHDDDAMGHEWESVPLPTMTEQEVQARIRTLMRERRGDYDAPLPPPVERRRIREAAGWTQEQVAKELHASRHTISRFEKKAGLVNGRRASGREPSGELRVAYSALLKRLREDEG
jgi:DNA-binding XRE family transcriptional regulator